MPELLPAGGAPGRGVAWTAAIRASMGGARQVKLSSNVRFVVSGGAEGELRARAPGTAAAAAGLLPAQRARDEASRAAFEIAARETSWEVRNLGDSQVAGRPGC